MILRRGQSILGYSDFPNVKKYQIWRSDDASRLLEDDHKFDNFHILDLENIESRLNFFGKLFRFI